MTSRIHATSALFAALALAACADQPTAVRQLPSASADVQPEAGQYAVTLESVKELAPRSILTAYVQQPGNPAVQVWKTGFGSAVAPGPTPGTLFLMTDRGPNIDYPGGTADGKLFPEPRYAPRIGLFAPAGKNLLRLVQSIDLALPSGKTLTGLPLPPGSCGFTNEKGYVLEKGTLSIVSDPDAIDSEGLAVASNGDFWIADEYGPFMARFDAAGRQRARFGPCAGGGVTAGLPAVLAARRANRGMEGITITPSGLVVGMMQSPLDNPRAAGRASRALRIVVFNPNQPTAAATKQYVYLAESAIMLSSEIVAIDDTHFLVLERDGLFPGAAGVIKRIYKIDLAGATDESDPANSATGKSYGAFGATLEAVTDHAGAGIVPVSKALVVDLMTDLVGYPHDKPEGITILGTDRIVISNDDDFGVVGDLTTGMLLRKALSNGATDYNSVWTVRVSPPLK